MTKLSETSLKLIERLEELWDDREFVIGIMSMAKTEEERAVVLDYIENGRDVSTDTVSVLAVHLSNQRKQKK